MKIDIQSNIAWQDGEITKEDRNRLNQHPSCVLWLTGLSGAGKSTLAIMLEQELHRQQIRSFILDGDNVRHGLNRDLGFSDHDRKENIRRIAELACLFSEAGFLIIVATISPFQIDRDIARQICGKDFIEVFIQCSLDVCEERDPKGLYKKARQGLITNFTGLSSPYETPKSPEVVIESDKIKKNKMILPVINYLINKNYMAGI